MQLLLSNSTMLSGRSADLGGSKLIVGQSLQLPKLSSVSIRQRRVHTSTRCAGNPDRDIYKEMSLNKRRTLYTWDNWKHHRSTSRYARNLRSIFSSEVLNGIGLPLLTSTGVAALTVAYMMLLQNGDLPAYFPDITLDVSSGIGPVSFALSLLLVFRTNSSYGRFQEVRGFFSGVTQRTRDLGRQAVIWFPKDQKDELDLFCRWATAFPISMMVHLRAGEDLRKELTNVLLPYELDMLEKSPHRPNTCLMMMSEVIKRTNLTPVQRFRMDENLTYFSDMLGASERILRTPIPLSYTRHTTRFLALWLTFLPLSIYKLCGLLTIPTTLLIAFVLLGIEEIGVIKEEPFSVLPLEAYVREVESDIKQMKEMGPCDVALRPAAKEVVNA